MSASKKDSRGSNSMAFEAQFRIAQRTARINIEIGDASEHARFLPAAISAVRGDEGELAARIVQVRSKAFDLRLAVVAGRLLVRHRQMAWPPEAKLGWPRLGDPNRFRLRPLPRRRLAFDDIGGGVKAAGEAAFTTALAELMGKVRITEPKNRAADLTEAARSPISGMAWFNPPKRKFVEGAP